MKFSERIDLAFAKLGLREPFIAAVVATLPRQIIEGDTPITAATNGTWFKFSEKWGSQWDDEQLFGLAFHESLHVVLMHMWRRGNLDPGVWNEANDAIINMEAKLRGYKLPDGGVSYPWVTQQMDSDDVYRRLMKDKPPQGGGKGGDKGQPDPKGGWDNSGDIKDAPDEATKADIEARIVTSAKMARDCGDKSSLIDRVLGEVGKPTVVWHDEMRAMMMQTARNDFSYAKFSRRFISRRMYMPALRSEEMGGLIIGMDVSGSVTPAMADQLCAEIQGVVDDTNPEWVTVVYCAERITGEQTFQRGEQLQLKVKGTGGTRFKPVFDRAEEIAQDRQVAAMIYLTDMEGDLDECPEPPWPVLWGNVGRGDYEAPFGRVVKVRL